MRRKLFAAFLLTLFALGLGMTGSAAAQGNAVWDAKYYKTPTLSGTPAITRKDNAIAFDWGTGSPGADMPNDNFSVRWGTDVFFPAGTYRFWALADDNVRVNVGFAIRPQIDTFNNPAVNQIVSADVTLPTGTHHIQVDYREVTETARVFVTWANLATNPSGPNFPTPVPQPTPIPQPIPVSGGGWTAQYYSNQSLAGNPVAIIAESSPTHDWGSSAPLSSLPADNFSVRWTSSQTLNGGTYRLTLRADDGVRLYINGARIIDEWHSATGVTYTTDITLSTGTHNFMVEYYEAGGRAFLDYDLALVSGTIVFPFPQPTATPVFVPSPVIGLPGNWLATYFNNRSLAGTPSAILSEGSPDHDWGQGSPVPSVGNDNFSARWTSSQTLSAGTYRITARADDGIRVFVNGAAVINEWHQATGQAYKADITLPAGTHNFTIDYYEAEGRAFIEFSLGVASATNVADTSIATGTAAVTATRLNVREQPTTSSNIVAKISEGETYPVVGCNTDKSWWQLNINGIRGWVYAPFVDIANANCVPTVNSSTSPQYPPTGYVVTAFVTLNMRSQPATQGALLGQLGAGQSATIVGRNANATWWMIEHNGITGWVSSAFTRVQPTADLNRIPIRG